MARSAEIGSLRVALGLDSAQFAAGAAKAQSSLQKLSGQFKAFAAGAIAALSAGAIANAFTSITGRMDELGKAAQKIGIPVAELSKLSYAAKLADVPLETLQTSVARLSKGLAEFQSTGKGAAGEALQALGVSALTANGQLRPTSEILQDVAAKFATYQDGANKTALAMALFGKAGADMIPLLNGGRQAIADAAAEAEQFGVVVDSKAAAAAEQFNDNLTRLQTAGQGLAQIVVAQMLPAMADLTDKVVGYVKSAEGAKAITEGVGRIMQQASAFIATTAREFQALGILFNTVSENFSRADGFEAAMGRWKAAFAEIQRLKDQAASNGGFLNRAAIDEVLSSIPSPGKGDMEKFKPKALAPSLGSSTTNLTTQIRRASSATKELGKTADIVLPRMKPQLDAVAQGATGIGANIDAATATLSDFGQQTLQTVGGQFGDWIRSALDGTFKLKDALAGLASTLADIGINFFLNSLSGGGSGSGLGSFLGGLLGFAKGGTILPGGSGGIDSQLVMFRKSPNERVDITKPGQKLTAGGGTVVNFTQHINGNGDQYISQVARREAEAGIRTAIKGERRRAVDYDMRFARS